MEIQELIYPLAGLLAISAISEAVVEIIKSSTGIVFSEKGKRILSAMSSILVAFALDVSIIQADGPRYFIGVLLAGVISSRGSNFIHDLMSILNDLSNKTDKKYS